MDPIQHPSFGQIASLFKEAMPESFSQDKISGGDRVLQYSLLLLHPENSFLLRGIKMVSTSPDHCNRWKGAITLLVSPFAEVMRLGAGVIGVVGGGVAATASMTFHGISQLENKAEETMHLVNSAMRGRDLMQSFVKMMNEELIHSHASEQEKIYLREHPELLLAIAAVAFAFVGRNRLEDGLQVGDVLIKHDGMGAEEYQKDFIADLCSIKEGIQGLDLDVHDTAAWEHLICLLHTFHGMPRDSYYIRMKDYLAQIIHHAESFSHRIAKNNDFLELWGADACS